MLRWRTKSASTILRYMCIRRKIK